MDYFVDIYFSKVEELFALPSASGSLICMGLGMHVCVCMCEGAHACMHACTHFCTPVSPTDEKQESILGSIPLLSFRVAAVQPSDNISRKHTFKVSWASSSRWEKEGVGSSRTWG